MATFKAFLVTEDNGQFRQEVVQRSFDALPDNDVLIKVSYSSLNYKDALSASGHKGVTREYPHTPGIDAAGVVVSDRTGRWQPGTEVVVIGYDLGMNTSGGFAEFISVPAEWPIQLPDNISLEESMMLGTAGITAAYCLEKLLDNGLVANNGEVLVTGATGGVGAFALTMLAQMGFSVVASSGKPEASEWLLELGASRVVDRHEIGTQSSRPMLKSEWAGAVDSVGGHTLENIVKSLKFGGSVAACGNVAGVDLQMTVFPYILRGVNLLGVASADASRDDRIRAFGKLASMWKPVQLRNMVQHVGLSGLSEQIRQMLTGQHQKRVVVDLAKE
ncbi:YhdH/YhfP family quinone oxidoreductase [Gynuella sp.]|uniref:YhdH/YhfP family quinone oxidoreductase n=1 Tax=Gynuella sp. TaxID=2969146 RepID=UPI003D0BD319